MPQDKSVSLRIKMSSRLHKLPNQKLIRFLFHSLRNILYLALRKDACAHEREMPKHVGSKVVFCCNYFLRYGFGVRYLLSIISWLFIVFKACFVWNFESELACELFMIVIPVIDSEATSWFRNPASYFGLVINPKMIMLCFLRGTLFCGIP